MGRVLVFEKSSKNDSCQFNPSITPNGSGDLLDGFCRLLGCRRYAGNASGRQHAKRCGKTASDRRQCYYRPEKLLMALRWVGRTPSRQEKNENAFAISEGNEMERGDWRDYF
jgi:hypothetical protein